MFLGLRAFRQTQRRVGFFRNSRYPVKLVFEKPEDGMTIDEIIGAIRIYC